MFIKLTNGTPETYTIEQLRRDNPNISFPKDIPADILASYDVYPVKRIPAPQIDYNTHTHVQETSLVDGEWTQAWAVVELPLDQAETNIRAHRERLLQETDWMALIDNTLTSDWATYRQTLRDISSQEGFPYSIVWPDKPVS